MTDRQALRDELATATRILARHGLIGMFGHVSLLTDDPERYLICPGAGRRKDRCRPEDVHELSLDDEFTPGLPLELYMHAAMHRARPDLRSLVHVHSPHLTALAAMAEPPAELLMPHASFWPDRIPLWERAELVTDHAAGDALVRVIGDSALALLRWHGAVVVGRTLREAVFRTVLAERHAGLLLASLAHGRPLAPVTIDRDALYAGVLPSTTHDLNWRFESSYVRLDEM
ncbi:class II aldolase/adducin family protein [Streptomyces pseudovenezuelae]|uniref:Ribulose-5-phosphate 4-epimerase/fuculose-1-phosphate aldolase n=1 Tax=Streptomyces pseudovenezuelae TaxID=67350 RepID=A0ABT6LCH1_9ACTN|nr:class II aldolase/adducin family protein [Streptomyces pseudovenezuelae]MDH6214008.1 ribulose-5-phosphate 4-epimerase/fuculose-1-phosphate aldolase [Streptomyces pseudovenezuelae]